MTTTNSVPFFVLRLNHHHPFSTTIAPTVRLTNDDDDNDAETASTSSLRYLHYNTKVLFTVPKHLANSIILHPILCCGAYFHLTLDVNDDTDNNVHSKTTTATTFVCTTYESTNPDYTAEEIAKRITIRIENILLMQQHTTAAVTAVTSQQQQQQMEVVTTTFQNNIDNITSPQPQQNDWASQLLFL